MKKLALLTLALSLLQAAPASAELIFSAPPRESVEEGNKLYMPLAHKISEALGVQVVYHHPRSWAEYADGIRNNKYDILFDGPHFASWRQKHLGHQAVARFSGSLSFIIAAQADNSRVTDMDAIRVSRVCTYASPNLTASVLLDLFRNDIIQPKIVAIKGGMKDVYQALLAGQCEAAVFRKSFYDKQLGKEQRGKLHAIKQTRSFPNQGFTASERLTAEQRLTLQRLLTEDKKITAPLIQRFTKGKAQFIPAQAEEYAGLTNLLEGIVWGW